MLKFLRSPSTIIAVLAGIAGVLLVLYAWRLPPFVTSVETTDNAYVRGYVTILSPQVSGYVVDVPVKDYQQVKQGDTLAQIAPSDAQARNATRVSGRFGRKPTTRSPFTTPQLSSFRRAPATNARRSLKL